MESSKLIEQCKELQSIYPQLSMLESEQEIIIEGTLEFNAEDNDIPINDRYNVKMHVPKDFPKSVPTVWETDGRIPKKFMHFLVDGSLCLGTQTEIALNLNQNPSLSFFVKNFMVNYLYAASYYEKYGTMPFGERAHGYEGVFDFYKDLLEVDTKEKVLGILQVICLRKYRGHQPCPCGSGKNMRNCKHKDVILNLITSDIMENIQDDYINLIQNERDKYGKVRSSK
jgi:hypothetical protein